MAEDQNQDNAHGTDEPGAELKVVERPRKIDKGAIMSALQKMRGKGGSSDLRDPRAEKRAIRAGEPIGEPGGLDLDVGDEVDQEDADLGLDPDPIDEEDETDDGDRVRPRSSVARDAEEQEYGDQEGSEQEADGDAVELTPAQQAKLRVKQEAQRHRAKSQEALREAERARREAEEDRAAAKREREEAERLRQSEKEAREKAAKDPYKFLEELTGDTFDDLVRGKIEENTPEGRISALQKQNAALAKGFKELVEGIQREKQEAEEARRNHEQETAKTREQQEAEDSRQRFVKLAEGSAKKFPVVARLAKKAPAILIGMGYSAHFEFQAEHGRPGTQEELLATIEKAFEEEDQEDEQERGATPKKRPGSVVRREASPPPRKLSGLSDAEKKALAKRELLRLRGRPVARAS